MKLLQLTLEPAYAGSAQYRATCTADGRIAFNDRYDSLQRVAVLTRYHMLEEGVTHPTIVVENANGRSAFIRRELTDLIGCDAVLREAKALREKEHERRKHAI